MKSIIQPEEEYKTCFLCGRNGVSDPLERHHIFGGSNRKHSEKDGLCVWLCGSRCHRNGPLSAHMNRQTADKLRRIGQSAWEKRYGTRDEFVSRYGVIINTDANSYLG